MEQPEERAPLAGLPAPPARKIAAMVRGAWWHSGGMLNSDVRDDCELEASLALWQVREKLKSLPEAEREAYAATCVRHRLCEFLRQERRHRARIVSVEVLLRRGESLTELAAQRSPGGDGPAIGSLLDQIGHPDLAAAMHTLPARDRDILELHYAQDLTDADIAQRMNLRPAAVKMQRHRALVKIRQLLRRRERGESPRGPSVD